MDVLPLLNASLAGRYLIERQIGQGGMATVYLARDVKHDRHVALKVLDPELGAVVGKDRFLAEIGVTARLQHPHLLPLFDSGEADGQLFYVMPYVQGETLRDRLQREKQLPIDEAVRIAATVALALAYAHRQGVIHRDLKPENILLHDGQPLLADFGIALALSIAGGARITQTGLSLGTPQYMSPEQATGDRDIDARTDIYSLGAVTYEMLTGDPPHTGSTAQAVIARVLTDKPRPIRLTRDAVPRHVEAAVECALAKLPADRFATASDFADALRGTRPASVPASYVTPGSTTSDPSLRVTRRRRWPSVVPWVAAVIATSVAVALWRRPGSPSPVRRFELADAEVRYRTGNSATLALSPDGSRLVYAGGPEASSQLYLHDFSQLGAVPIRGSDRSAAPLFSRDGRSLWFLTDGRLKRFDLDRGTLVAVNDSGGPAAWSGNHIIFTRGSALYEVPDAGGPVRRIADTTSLPGVTGLAWPAALPAGDAVLITLRHAGGLPRASIGVVRLSDGKITDLKVEGLNPRYLPTGHVIFGRADGNVYGMAFDAGRLVLSGPAVPLLEGVVVKNGGATEIAVAENGTMAYRTGFFTRRMVLVDRRGAPTSLVTEPRDYSFPSVSPDGRRIALSIGTTTIRSDTWIFDRQTGTLTRLTRTGGERPEWTPDGNRVLTVVADGISRVVSQPWDGSGAVDEYAAHPAGILEISVPRGGSGFLAVRTGAVGGQRDIWIAPLDSPRALRPFVASEFDEYTPSVSPDGKLLAYISNESGRAELYVRQMTDAQARVQISSTGAIEPLWSPTGRELIYRADRKIMAARITWPPVGGARVERESLFDDIYGSSGNAHATYAIMPDGNHFVFGQSAGQEPKLIIVLNWLDEVKRRMAAASH